MAVTLFIPYMLLAWFLHRGCLYISKDRLIADYVVPIFYNVIYLIVIPILWFNEVYPREGIAEHVMSALIGWYSVDTANLANSSYASRNVYIFHHIVSVNLILLHYLHILPLSIGKVFLTLFEASNLFLLPYQLALHKQWTFTRHLLTKPMVLLYVPLRVLGVPLCSITYIPYIYTLNTYMQIYCVILFVLINLFSLFFGIVIAHKYSLYLKKLSRK